MKKRVLSFALALLLFVMIPAETVMAMPAAQAQSMLTLAEEAADTEEVVDDTTFEEMEDEETYPTEEPAEEPVEEPTAEPIAEPEATEEPSETEVPAEEPTEEPAAEPEMTQEPTAEPTAEPEATEEPSETEVPAEAPTEEPTAEPEATEEPSATPSAEPTVAPKKDVELAGRDLTAKVVGSNGVQYENVTYLSVQAVNSLSSEGVDAYIKMCDDLAAMQESGMEIDKAVLSLDENGKLKIVVNVPTNTLFTADIQEQFLDDVEEDVTDEPAEETTEDTEAEDVADEAAAEDTEAEAADEVTAEDTADEATEVIGFVAENVELAQACALPEEMVAEVSAEELDTKMSNANYFKNQLNGTQKKIWNSGYAALVKDGKNFFNYIDERIAWDNFLVAVSALNLTYPNSFNWMQAGGRTSMEGEWLGGVKYKYTITIEKSSYYKASLETQAKEKVRQLVAAADSYATKSYPGNHVYGMVKYFDKWIRDNNYYNNDGTNDAKQYTEAFYYCHSCYGILLKGYGVCESYALAMTRLLDAAGIRNVYVTGYAGGGHAWNYVQMPNGSWYLLDSTWNDGSSSDAYLLIGSAADGGEHRAHGYMYSFYSNAFKFPKLASANYNANTEKTYINSITLNKTKVGIKPGATYQLKLSKAKGSNYFYSKYVKAWSSSNTNVAKVSKTGKITAVKPGSATISYVVDGIKKNCTVYVYQFTNLKFADNNKTSYSYTYANPDLTFDSKDVYTIKINVNQKDRAMSAASIQSGMGLKAPSVTSSKSGVATATATLSGDVINLKVTPKKVGSTTITVTFAGKKATYKLTNKYKLNSAWFNALPYSSKEYTGKAFAPAVTKSTAAPKGLKYTVSYKNNKNVGTATVVIKGSGSYTGTVERTFKITPKNIATAKFKSCTVSKIYNGAQQKAATVVMMGSKKLKEGTDYTVYYNNSTTVPTNKGVYTVKIVGKGNYNGSIATTKQYEIKALTMDKVKVTCTASKKYTGSAVAPVVTVKYGAKTIPASQYTITYKDNKNNTVAPSNLKAIGTYKVIITPKGSNFIASKNVTQITKTFKIVRK